MEGPSPLGRLADGGMEELVCRIVAVDVQGLVVRAFPGYVCTRVWSVAERALVCKSVAVSHAYFTIVQLSIYELEKGGPFPRTMNELLCAGSFLFTGDDGMPIERGMAYAT